MNITNHVLLKIRRIYEEDETIEGQGHDAKVTFDMIGLTDKQVQYFYEIFIKIDRDGSYVIELEEFYKYFKVQRTAFNGNIYILIQAPYCIHL